MEKSDSDKVVEDKKEKSEQERMQDFTKKYQALCEEYQFQLVVNPAFKAMADTGTFNIILQTGIGRLPSKQTE